MDENTKDDTASTSLFRRYRSPSFRKAEVKALVELVEKYKHIIINKSTNSSANYSKEKAWRKITKEFNSQHLGFKRTVDVLRTKWENLKRSARQLSKNVIDDECDYYKDEICKAVSIICATENGQSDVEDKKDNDLTCEKENYNSWTCDDEKNFLLSSDEEHKNFTPKKKCEIPMSFSPHDCRLLLQCVRQEKNVLFSKATVIQRRQAWKRIAHTFNEQSPQKRSPKELNSKFSSMKAMANRINIKGYLKNVKRKKYNHLKEDIDKEIKPEPIVDCAEDLDINIDRNYVLELSPATNSHNHITFNHDPLSNLHNSDSGLGSVTDSKNYTRLKVELLNFKMENARLERKRIEDAIEADKKEREMRALEHSMRLRAARLEVIAAESKLPLTHPALKYTLEEKRAQEYLCDTHLDIR